MAIKVDINLSAQENVLALVKGTFAEVPEVQALELTDLVIGTPAVAADVTNGNTTLDLESAEDSTKVKGTTTVTYNRIAPGAAVANLVTTVELAHDATPTDLLEAVSSVLGVAVADIDEGSLALPQAGETATVSVKVKASSLLYVGDVEMTITVGEKPVAELPNLSDLVAGALNGFEGA